MQLCFNRSMMRQVLMLMALFGLAACSTLRYQPVAVIDDVSKNPDGYRLQRALLNNKADKKDDVIGIVMLSGGGTRAAAFGYGVLESLKKQQVKIDGRPKSLLDTVDVVYGISGGSILATYFGLHGSETIPKFEQNFLNLNLQKMLIGQLFSMANWSRLGSPEFGRGDLLQEQLDLHLYHGATYADLNNKRQGPFVVISATDMSLGSRLDFTQEYFDLLCLDLTDLPIARAVAASSAVPLVFAPVTLNNNGGNCHYHLPDNLVDSNNVDATGTTSFRAQTRAVYRANLKQYQDSQKRPYIHLLDGGLTDNLGLRSLLDATELYSNKTLYDRLESAKIHKIIIINVNAQTQRKNSIDSSASVPGTAEVVRALTSIPIEKYSEDTQHQFQKYVDWWNESRSEGTPQVYYVSVNLLDMPPSPLRDKVIHIPTTFYLAHSEVNNLRKAAKLLLAQSSEYQRLIKDIGVEPDTSTPEPFTLYGDDVAATQADTDEESATDATGTDAVDNVQNHVSGVVNFINTEAVPILR
ncbi:MULTISPECIES: patatin-like phospholipase family protein [unclassified Snodgrassella]|uniref:patatin-like phospholipase family protein n=1 Tax=Snodgrassella TaxID=1193515 RepID=UPI00226AC2B3|nr:MULTISPECIES: patatin-like phospholipase family protein [unclassified Snodgrassella]MCX8748337.1 patatin-like phospholipase family protein [Snodgrassella sp. B3088]MCX8752677.1 patatin-like phospholipase family protein [Snodgrassella sp. B3837]